MGFIWGLYQIKMVSLFWDTLYVICGLIAIIVGIKIKGQTDITPYTQSGTDSIGQALIIFGCIIFVVSFVGSFAIIKDNKKALFAFGIALGALILLKLVVASIILYYLEDAGIAGKQQVVEIFEKGENDINSIDNIQRSFECCGVDGYFYWATSVDSALPPSCCSDKGKNADTSNCSPSHAYSVGCIEQVKSSVEGIGTTISLILFGIAFFEIAGLILTLCLQNTWNNEKRRDTEANIGPVPTAPSDDFS